MFKIINMYNDYNMTYITNSEIRYVMESRFP